VLNRKYNTDIGFENKQVKEEDSHTHFWQAFSHLII
jgi:hypothetical protein